MNGFSYGGCTPHQPITNKEVVSQEPGSESQEVVEDLPTGELTIYGASDDLIEFEGVYEDEIGCFSECTDGIYFEITNKDNLKDGLVVGLIYDDPAKNGCWNISVGQLGESIPLPDWGLKIITDIDKVDYSVVAHFADIPNNIQVQRIWAD